VTKPSIAAALAAIVLAACTSTAPVAPTGQDRYLIDPRIGYPAESVPGDASERLDAAWRFFLRHDFGQARRRSAEIRRQYPDYLPAALLEAAVDLREGNVTSARFNVERIVHQNPAWTAARVYEAEVALAAGEARRAFDIYRSLPPDAAPSVRERIASLEQTVFEQLLTSAQTAPDPEAIAFLEEALRINAGSTQARLLLARRLVSQKRFDDARAALEPLMSGVDVDRDDVQEMLAEIEVGTGRFQQAIIRFERLARRSSDVRYARRLEEVKELWNAANMPPQFQQALENPAITRADFAVLVYWKVNSVRFAQNLPTPPIAVDIADVPGRDEMIRAIAVGLYDVDPVTRRVSPQREVTAAALARLAGRILAIRGAACARGFSGLDALNACRIADPTAGIPPDLPVSGSMAVALLNEVNRVLSS
jgi:tetratricopeptide (TPR) repeat protein